MKYARGGIVHPISTPLDPDENVRRYVDEQNSRYAKWEAERIANHVHDAGCGQLWCPDPPKPRRRIRDLAGVRFVGITAAGALVALPIWWTLWHLADQYLGWIFT